MPLIHDSEYERELEIVAGKADSNGKRTYRRDFLLIASVLIGLFWGLNYFGASDAQFVATMILASTLCLTAVIYTAMRTMHRTLVLLTGAVEWAGRKQLGEYKSP